MTDNELANEIQRLTGRGMRRLACRVNVGRHFRCANAGGATPLACSFCGCVISSMGGPGAPGIACSLCAQAIRSPEHPLGVLLRETWGAALRAAQLDGA